MGGNKAEEVSENNNDPAFSKLNLLKRRNSMVNYTYSQERRPIQKIETESSSDSDLADEMNHSLVPVEENSAQDNWSLYNCLENTTRKNFVPEMEKREGRRADQFDMQMSYWSRSPMSAHSVFSEDEDEYLFRAMSSVSSARSSISWAEDAVESEFTEQLASMWDDIERVCGGEEKPPEMSQTVYDECLQWRRAFPQQTLLLPSRFANVRSEESTPTPTNAEDTIQMFDDAVGSCSALQDNSLADSSVEDCLTPNPNNSAQYVTSWLSDCHQTQFPFYQISIANVVKSPTIITASENHAGAILKPIPRKLSNSIKEELNLSDEHEEVTASSEFSQGHNSPLNVAKVQRPVSSYAKGHMITPMRTLPELMSQPYQSSQEKHVNNYFKNKPNAEYPNRITSSLPSGRTAPNTATSSQYLSQTRVQESPGSAYGFRRSPNYYGDYALKSRVSTTSNASQGTISSIPLSSHYWSRHSNSNSPNNVQDEASGPSELFFNVDFPNENTGESPRHRRPQNLPLGRKTTGESGNTTTEKPVKPFLFWLFDRVSPN